MNKTNKTKKRIIFAGTPLFSLPTLRALIDSASHLNYEICAVYTQPDRPAGRGRKLTASPVKQLALQKNLAVEQPQSLTDPAVQKKLADYHADMMIVVAYGLLLPEAVLELFPLGAINIHASLLPRWRGAAPIQQALLAGDTETGISIMKMEKGLDTGPVYCIEKCSLSKTTTTQQLHDTLAKLGPKTLLNCLAELIAGQLSPKSQQHNQATYAHKIKKEDAKINWTLPAIEIDRAIRAFNPVPIAFTCLVDLVIRMWHSELLSESTIAPPGTIIAAQPKGIDVATGEGVIRLLTMQFPGGKPLSVRDLLNSKKELLQPGTQLGTQSE